MRLLSILALTCCAALAGAVEEARKANLEKLFTILDLRTQYENNLIAGFEAGAKMGSDQLPPAMQAKMAAGMARCKELMKVEMSYETMMGMMMDTYAAKFTEAEVVATIAALDNPVARAFFTKQQQMIPDMVAVTTAKTKTLMPKIQQIMTEEMTKP
jgi:hypothetical protein